MADRIVSWGGFDSKSTSGMGVTGSLSISSGSIAVSGPNSMSFSYTINDTSPTFIKMTNGGNGADTGGTIAFPYGTITGNFGGITLTNSGGSSYYLKLASSGDLSWTGANFNLQTSGNSLIGSNGISGTSMTFKSGGSFVFNSFSGGFRDVIKFSQAGNLQVGGFTDAARLEVKGSGTTSSTTALLVQNANASASLSVRDDGLVTVGSNLNFGSVNNYIYWSDGNQRIEGGNNFYSYSGNWSFNRANDSTTVVQIGTGNNIYFRGTLRGLANETLTVTGGSVGGSRGYDLVVKGTNATTAPEYTAGHGGDLILENGLATDNSQGKGGTPGSIIFKYGVYNNTASVEYGRINSSGSFLIGTSTGSAKVLISGSSSSTLLEIDSPAVNNILFVSGSGNVGIGTGTPSKKLDVVGTAADGIIRVAGPYSEIQLINKNSPYNTGDWKPSIYFLENGVFQSSIEYAGGYFEFGSGLKSSTIYTTGASNSLGITNSDVTVDIGGRSQLITFTDYNYGLIRGGINLPYVASPSGYGMNIYVNSGAMTFGTGGSTRLSIAQAGGVTISGSGTTSSTTALLVQNANASNMLSLTDNGTLTVNTFQTSSTAFTINRTNSTMGSSFNGATLGTLVTINDTVGNSNGSKTTLYINSSGASTNNAAEIYGGVGIGYAPYGTNFYVGYNTAIYNTARIQTATGFPLTSRDATQNYNTSTGGGISFWGDASGQGTGQSAYAGIRGLKANNTYVNGLGNLAFYVQTGSSHVITETTFREVGRFNELGYFGIGTSTPSASLHVSGSSIFTNTVTISGPNAAVTMPSRPAFRVTGSGTMANLTTTQNGDGTLNQNNWAVDYQQGSALTGSTGVFTAPLAGLYQISLVGRNSGYSSGISQIAVVKYSGASSAVQIMVEWASSSTMNHTGGSSITYMNVGDTLKLKVLAGEINFDGNDNWSVAYIG